MTPLSVCDRWLSSMTDDDRRDTPAIAVAYHALNCHRTGARPDRLDGQARRDLRPGGVPGAPHWGRSEWRRHATILLSLAAETRDPVARQWLTERANDALDTVEATCPAP